MEQCLVESYSWMAGACTPSSAGRGATWGGGSDNSADPQSFLDGTLKALRALGCSSERAVELAAYKLEDMANTWYETLVIYAPYLVPTEEARVQRFVDGLVGRLYTAIAPQMKTLSYSDIVDLARKIENKGRDEYAASDLRKKAKIEGTFSGGFNENRRAGNQGQKQQQQQSSQTGTHIYMPLLQSARPVVDHLGQCHVLIGECFWCGQLGHHLRDCPQPPRNFNQASIQSTALTQATRNTSGATSIGNRVRGAGDRTTDAQASNVVVTGILSVCSFDALALIDPGSTHSYVSSYFSLRFSRQPEPLNDPFLVATHVGESLLAKYVYRACQIRVEGRDTLADLIVLDMIDFDMLMGMNWLSSCYAIVDCHAKIVKFEIPNEPSFILRGSQVPEICKVVSFMKAQRLMKKGCLGLLDIVNDTRKETVRIENVRVVREFSNVFPEDLPGLPPVREINFGIDLLLDIEPIPIELRELKQQLQDLLDKGFIGPSVSP
ncbi:uncharacterized protein [Nicotiana sylvestris]|uniref:uncharacterized protein n=1 Tax=Nicotiana sylvestris TaxID=4096 RepID=UPI00388C5408